MSNGDLVPAGTRILQIDVFDSAGTWQTRMLCKNINSMRYTVLHEILQPDHRGGLVVYEQMNMVPEMVERAIIAEGLITIIYRSGWFIEITRQRA